MTREELGRCVADDYEIRGLALDDIVRKWRGEGLTVYMTRKLLIERGVTIRSRGVRKKPLDLEEAAAVLRDYEKPGASTRTVGEKWGRSHEWVRQRVKDAREEEARHG